MDAAGVHVYLLVSVEFYCQLRIRCPPPEIEARGGGLNEWEAGLKHRAPHSFTPGPPVLNLWGRTAENQLTVRIAQGLPGFYCTVVS